jgi:hypothetical protein
MMQELEAVPPGALDTKKLRAGLTDEDVLRVGTDSDSTPATSGRVPGMKGGNMRYRDGGTRRR